MLNDKELKKLEDFARMGETSVDSLIFKAVQEIRENRKAVPSQMPLGEITQEILNKYYVYLETPDGNKVIHKILPTGNDRVVVVYADGGSYIKFRTVLVLVSSVPK